jgi:hypothetical protein
MGECNYSFRLGVVDSDRLDRETQKFTEKPCAVNVFPVPGERKPQRDFKVSVSDDCITAVTVKKADGRDALIFRLHNNTSGRRSCRLSVDNAEIGLDFGKYEVKTVLLENGTLTESAELII